MDIVEKNNILEKTVNIVVKRGNIFNSSCEYLVNPVNCEGYMGKGLALEFKILYNDFFKEYKKECEEKRIRPGILLVTKRANDKGVVHFPTKFNYKYPSKMEYIEVGLAKFIEIYKEKGIKTIAFPQIGTGLGGLNWPEVKKKIIDSLKNLEGLEVEIYEYDNGNEANELIKKLLETIKRKEVSEFKKFIKSKDDKKIKKIITIIKKIKEAENLEKIKQVSDLLKLDKIGEESIIQLINNIDKNILTSDQNVEVIKQTSLF